MTYPIQAKYNTFNAQYFKGSLPEIPLFLKPLKGLGGVVRFRVTKPVGAAGQGVLVPGSVSLTLSNMFQKSEAEMDAILLHEMIHVHFVNIGDYKEMHGPGFMVMRNQLSKASGILVPVTDKIAGDINLTSSKTKPYGVLLIKNKDGRYSYGVISMAAMAQVEAIKEKWTGRAQYGGFGVALYTIDTLLWSTKAAQVTVSKGDPKQLYILKDDQLAQDLFQNGNLVFAVQERAK